EAYDAEGVATTARFGASFVAARVNAGVDTIIAHRGKTNRNRLHFITNSPFAYTYFEGCRGNTIEKFSRSLHIANALSTIPNHHIGLGAPASRWLVARNCMIQFTAPLV